MRWRAVLGVAGLGSGLLLSACGGAPAAAPTPAQTSEVVTVTPTTARVIASVTASPASATPVAAGTSGPTPQAATTSATVYVANTDGQGVFVRKTPAMADRLRAYPDGTPLKITGEDVDAEGQHWHHVQTPDGQDGYVPAMYTVDTPP